MIAYEENSVLIFYVLIIFLIFLHACAVNGEVTSVICQHNFGRKIRIDIYCLRYETLD